ncbi:MAG: chlorophyll synthase ChlG [Hyphomicrobium sp.]|jgi:chlorophyll synthase|nr:chlorophyll synthase ChlG [Hyphomicrobium sp.]
MATPALTVSRLEPSAVLELLKPITWFPPMWALACGVVSSGYDGSLERLPLVIVGVLLAGPLVCGTSQAVNDWFDRHVDAINEPNRPIPSGRIPGRLGLVIAIVWSILSLAVSTFLGIWGVIATVVGLALAWAYSMPPVRLKKNGWYGNAAVGACYEGLPWFTGALVMSAALPGHEILAMAALYSIGAHGIMTLNDFKSIEGDIKLGIRSLPVQLGPDRAARLACIVMALPQFVVILLLAHWGHTVSALLVGLVLIAQIALMSVLVRDPRGRAPWYNATGISLYVTGMMIAAIAIRPDIGLHP